MSDNLVKRARHNANADMPHYASVELIEAMADRIEQLAATNEELEAKLAKAVAIAKDAIETMEDDPFFPYREGERLRTALVELKGQDDE